MRPLCLAALVLAGLTGVHARAEPRTLIGEQWHGTDGNWSTTQIWVGNVEVVDATMNLIISTSLSETWVVGSGGCVKNEQLCPKYRGGLLDIGDSNTWQSLGDWLLAFPYGNVEANGNFGLDTVVIRDSQTKTLVALDKALIVAYNSTEYYNGFFGLGIVSGKFGEQTVDSPFSQMVAKYGWFPSYTYGYTAGAYYKGSGTPSSLVLGGYDENRFVSHDTEFTLTRDTAQPKALVRGIEVSAPEGMDLPDGWDSRTQILSNMTESFDALIDSSTPYLWLPESVCSKFVKALSLSYNKELDAYELLNDQFNQLRAEDSFSFTFSLSSYDNVDDFGHPLDVPGVVNITLSAHAFAQVLTYPYHNMAIKYKEKAVPYFPIKVASNNTFILGRTFLQEAYLLTKYDSTVFSVHQARFPEDVHDTEIRAVEQPANSQYPPPADINTDSPGLKKDQMIGIVVGVVVVSLIALIALCCCCKRRRRKNHAPKIFADDDAKDTASSIVSEPPKTPVGRILSKIIRRKRSKKVESVEASGTDSNPAEVGADATHEVYELSAPIGPVELDADTHSIASETELGTEGTDQLTPYEVARRKMERRLQGPVPAYTPSVDSPTIGTVGSSTNGEKSIQDVSPVETYRPGDRISPASSPTNTHSGSLPRSMPSPMSPRADWNIHGGDLPSPMTIPPSFPSPTYQRSTGALGSVSSRSHTYEPSSISRSSSSTTGPSPTTPSSTNTHSSSMFQRTPIDPSRIICLGPLPENVQLPLPSPSNSILPRARANSGPRSPGFLGASNPEARVSTDTLGSNFTEVEEQQLEQSSPSTVRRAGLASHHVVRRSQSQPHPAGGYQQQQQQHTLESPRSLERIDAGAELVHVPQLAERRYSWEEER